MAKEKNNKKKSGKVADIVLSAQKVDATQREILNAETDYAKKFLLYSMADDRRKAAHADGLKAKEEHSSLLRGLK